MYVSGETPPKSPSPILRKQMRPQTGPPDTVPRPGKMSCVGLSPNQQLKCVHRTNFSLISKMQSVGGRGGEYRLPRPVSQTRMSKPSIVSSRNHWLTLLTNVGTTVRNQTPGNQTRCCVKGWMHQNQIGFIPGTERCFHSGNSIRVSHCINGIKEKDFTMVESEGASVTGVHLCF